MLASKRHHFFWIVFASVCLLFLAVMVLSFPLGAYLIEYGKGAGQRTDTLAAQLVVFIIGLPLILQPDLSKGQLFFAVWSIYLIFLILSMIGPRTDVRTAVRQLIHGDLKVALGNGAFLVTVVFTLLFSATVLLQSIQEAAGIPTGSLPNQNFVDQFVLITVAPLAEEIGFRVTMIGLFSLLWMKRARSFGNVLGVLWWPQRYLGWPRDSWFFRILTGVLIVGSGLIFGAAHVVYGAGWDVGKVSIAAISGVALGWVYFTAGFPSAVLIHWGFNYLTGTMSYSETNLGLAWLTEVFVVFVYLVGIMALAGIIISVRNRPKSSGEEALKETL